MPLRFSDFVTQDLITSIVTEQISIGNSLPTVNDPSLRSRLNAPSFVTKAGYKTGSETFVDSLETLGDWVLTYELGKVLWRFKPAISPALLTVSAIVTMYGLGLTMLLLQQVRHCLANNHTFAYLTIAYKLDAEIRSKIPTGNRRGKALADIFEMRMGALCEEDRECDVRRWCATVGLEMMKAVYESVVRLQDEQVRMEQEGEVFLAEALPCAD